MRFTEQQARQIGIPGAGTAQEKTARAGRSKYRAQPQRAYGRLWASRAELRRYDQLLRLGDLGEIQNLEIQPRYPLTSGGAPIATYIGDFAYDDLAGGGIRLADGRILGWHRVVEDVKSPATARLPLYRLKIKLFRAQYPQLVFREVR